MGVRWGMTAIAVASLGLAAIGVVAAPGAPAAPIERLAGVHVLSGTGPGETAVRVPIGVTFVVRTDRTSDAVAIRGGGPAVAVTLSRRTTDQTTVTREVVITRVAACDELECTADADAEQIAVAAGGGVAQQDGTRYRLPPGVYDIVVAAADGEPVQVELRFDGGRGAAETALADAGRARVLPMALAATAPGHAARAVDVVTGATSIIGALRMSGSGSVMAGAAVEWCQFSDGSAPLSGLVLPGCPAQVSNDNRTPRSGQLGTLRVFASTGDGTSATSLSAWGERPTVTVRTGAPTTALRLEAWAIALRD